MASQKDVSTFEDVEDKILKIGTSVYGKIHFGIPFQRTTPLPDQYVYIGDIFNACKPFALTRNDIWYAAQFFL